MATMKEGQKEIRVVLEKDSEPHITLAEWGQRRGLTPAKSARCVLTDWSDAMNGRPNPFAMAIAAAAGIVAGPERFGQIASTAEPEISAEEKARQQALLQAAEQFL